MFWCFVLSRCSPAGWWRRETVGVRSRPVLRGRPVTSVRFLVMLRLDRLCASQDAQRCGLAHQRAQHALWRCAQRTVTGRVRDLTRGRATLGIQRPGRDPRSSEIQDIAPLPRPAGTPSSGTCDSQLPGQLGEPSLFRAALTFDCSASRLSRRSLAGSSTTRTGQSINRRGHSLPSCVAQNWPRCLRTIYFQAHQQIQSLERCAHFWKRCFRYALCFWDKLPSADFGSKVSDCQFSLPSSLRSLKNYLLVLVSFSKFPASAVAS